MHAYQPERLTPEKPKAGLLGSLFSQHPALFGGAVVSVITMSAVFVNAVWYQPVTHPSPMFSTRVIDKTATASTKKAKAKTSKAKKKVRVASAASEEVLREVQSALAVRGYYGGKVDGKYGSRTKKAIVSFQQDHSLAQDGTASVRLLSQILLSASATPQEVPVPRSQAVAAAPVKQEMVTTAKVEPQAQPDVQTEVQTQTKVKTVAVPLKPVSESNSGLVARIQSGLRNYGYEELVVDGKPGKQTKDAIQSFQLDYGMKITGEPSETVLNKLQEIGAYKQG